MARTRPADGGALGRVQAVDAVLRSGYGREQGLVPRPGFSGGGCVMDLGIHLVDLALRALGSPEAEDRAAARPGHRP